MGDIINSFSRKHTASKPKQQNCAILYIPTLGYLEELNTCNWKNRGGWAGHFNRLPVSYQLFTKENTGSSSSGCALIEENSSLVICFPTGGKHRRNKKYMSPRPPIIHAVLCPKCLLLRFYNNAETRCLSINNRLTLNKQDVQGFSLKYGECMWERG